MMYLSHFGLTLHPFQINTDQRFLYLSEKHQEALAILRYGILDNRGILVLTGDVGTGKTILVHALLESLGPEVLTAVIADPSLKGLDFFNFLAHAFGMENDFKTKGGFLIQLGNFLDRQFKANRRVLLVIDEAQNIDPDQLEKIRILSDIERDHNQRINVFFVGQSEFNVKLEDSRLRALKQRITSHYHIEPLSLKETVAYVGHRLKVAGCDRPLFKPTALKKIFELTKGYPRLINIVCDHCLLSAFAKDLSDIGPMLVKEAAADLMHPSQFSEPHLSPPENKPRMAKTPKADIQPCTATTTLPVVNTQKAEQAPPPGHLTSFALLLQAFIRKPAYLLAVGVLLPALVWLHFRYDPYAGRQVSSLSSKINQDNKPNAVAKPIQSSTLNKYLGAPPLSPAQKQEPAESANRISAENPLIKTATATLDPSTSPGGGSPAVQPEDVAPSSDNTIQASPQVELLAADSPEDMAQPKNLLLQESSPSTDHNRPINSMAENNVNRSTDQPSSNAAATQNRSKLKPSEVRLPIRSVTATLGKRTIDNEELPSSILKLDEIAAPDNKVAAANIDDHTAGLSTIPLTSDIDAPAMPAEKKGGEGWMDTEVTSVLPETAPKTIETPIKNLTDQATKPDFSDEASLASSAASLTDTPLAEPTADEFQFQDTDSDPRVIIDFVMKKRTIQTEDQ